MSDRSIRLNGSGVAACVASAMALAIGPGRGAAAEPEPEQLEEIAEIVVTAQFREQNLQEAPLAITAVDAALLEARGQTNIAQVAGTAPSVTISAGGQGGGSQTAAVMIRGIGQTDFQFPNEPGVGVYIDDVYYGILFGTAFDLVDLDRVEILRGPQGTLSGKNSIGGSIKLFSRKPNGDTSGYAEAQAGSYGRVGVKAASNFTLVEDKLYARISGISRQVDGFLQRLDYNCTHPGSANPAPGGLFAQPSQDCVIGTEGGQNVVAARGQLRWVPTDNIEDNLIADVTRDRSEASPGKAVFLAPVDGRNYITPPGSYTNYATYTGYAGQADQYTNPAISHLDAWGVTNTLDIGIGEDWDLKSISAYRFTEGAAGWDGENSPENASNNYALFDHEQFTQELRLSTTVAGKTDLTFGAYYYDASSHVGGRVHVGAAPGGNFDFLSWDPFKQTSKSLFAHGVYHATGRLNLTGGVRYTEEDKTYTFTRAPSTAGAAENPIFVGFVSPMDGLSAKFKGDRVDWRVAADYEFIPDVRGYAQVATGFKGGGVNPRPYYITQAVPFEQETSTSWEVGLKSMLFGRRLRLNVDYFSNDYKNYQGMVGSCPDITPAEGAPLCSATRNVGDAKIKGAELEFDVRPVAGLAIDGSVSYVDFKFTSGLAGSGIVPGLTHAAYVPKWKVSLGVQYAFKLASGAAITPRADWTAQSEFESAIPNRVPDYDYGHVAGRGLLNLRLPWSSASGDWEAALAVTNVTDKFYYVNMYDRYAQSANAYGQPGRPREYIFTVKRSF